MSFLGGIVQDKVKGKQGHPNSGNSNGIYFPVDAFCLDGPFHRARKQCLHGECLPET